MEHKHCKRVHAYSPSRLQGEEKSERGHTSWPDLQSRKVRSSPRGQNLRFRLFHCTSFEVGRSGGEGERNPLGSPAFHSRISAHLSRIKHSILGASRRRNGRSRPGPCGTQPGWSLQGPLHSWRSSRGPEGQVPAPKRGWKESWETKPIPIFIEDSNSFIENTGNSSVCLSVEKAPRRLFVACRQMGAVSERIHSLSSE